MSRPLPTLTLNDVTSIQRTWKQIEWDAWEARCQFHERNGNDRSDAQGMTDLDCMYERRWCCNLDCGRLITEAGDARLPIANNVCNDCEGRPGQ
jgi:hypothetical protein